MSSRAVVATLRPTRRAAARRGVATSAPLTRAAAPAFANDFDHHAPGIARMNHGSFGSPPAPVLRATEEIRRRWLAHPDAEYQRLSGIRRLLLRQRAGRGFDDPSVLALSSRRTTAAKIIRTGDPSLALSSRRTTAAKIIRTGSSPRRARCSQVLLRKPRPRLDRGVGRRGSGRASARGRGLPRGERDRLVRHHVAKMGRDARRDAAFTVHGLRRRQNGRAPCFRLRARLRVADGVPRDDARFYFDGA